MSRPWRWRNLQTSWWYLSQLWEWGTGKVIRSSATQCPGMKRKTGHQILCSAFADPASEADSVKYHSKTWGKRMEVGIWGSNLAANSNRQSVGDSAYVLVWFRNIRGTENPNTASGHSAILCPNLHWIWLWILIILRCVSLLWGLVNQNLLTPFLFSL